MQWLNKIVDELLKRQPDGEILIETGSSPSGTYHLGHLRELVTADAIMLELKRRGRQAKHVQFVDDLDALRKIPVNIPSDYEKYLGYPICDIPAPDGSDQSYAEYFLQGLIEACQTLGVEVDYVKAHQKYQEGFYVPAIECSLEQIPKVKNVLETVSGRKLDESWSPMQVMEDGRLKKRKFLELDKTTKTLTYEDADGRPQTIGYDDGKVKLDWRLDWPARWWLQNVACEPSGRDHSTKGGSVETGEHICRYIYDAEPPLAVPYDFINLAGDTKKMSASKGTGLDAISTVTVLPPEIVRYLILRAPPSKRLYFDPENIAQLMDEFAALVANEGRNESEQQLFEVSTRGIKPTVSSIPFTQLVASYQAALKDLVKTMELLERTVRAEFLKPDKEVIKDELIFIDEWLKNWAPDDIKFELADKIDPNDFSEPGKNFLKSLADKIEEAPANADGEWFHKAVYDLKDTGGLEPKDLFRTLYQALIAKDSGPRAGWFLSILPRDWLIKRLKLEG